MKFKQIEDYENTSRVFLGETCNNSTWRDEIIPLLKIQHFNPVVSNWTTKAQAEELKQRKECDVCLYVITPKMAGVYSIAEAIDDSNKRPEKTIFFYMETDGIDQFNAKQLKSLNMVGRMVRRNGGVWGEGHLKDLADLLNRR